MSQTKVMVVEDEFIIAMDLKMRLERMGYYVPELPDISGISLESVAAESPDIVLMDIRLGDGIDGISLAGEIYNKLDIPVIFTTAHSDSITLDRAGRTNPYGYLIKPMKDQEVQISITMALHKHHTESQLRKLFANTPDGVVVIRRDDELRDFVIDAVNPTAMELDGVGEDMVGRSLASYLMRSICYDLEGDGCFGLIETVFRVWKDGTSLPYTLTAIRDNTIIGWRDYFVYRSSKDEVTVVFRDITEQKRLEEALRLRTSDMMYSIDHLSALRSALEISMQSRLSIPRRLSYVVDFMAQAVHEPELMSVRVSWKDHEVRNSGFRGMEWTFSRPILSGGNRVGLVEWGYSADRERLFEGPFSREEVDLFESIVQIISHLVEDDRREEVLQERSYKYLSLLNAVKDPLMFVGSTGKVDFVNEAMEGFLDMASEEVESLPVDMIPPVMGRELGKVCARVYESGVGEVLSLPGGRGEVRPAPDRDGNVAGVLLVFPPREGDQDESR